MLLHQYFQHKQYRKLLITKQSSGQAAYLNRCATRGCLNICYA